METEQRPCTCLAQARRGWLSAGGVNGHRGSWGRSPNPEHPVGGGSQAARAAPGPTRSHHFCAQSMRLARKKPFPDVVGAISLNDPSRPWLGIRDRLTCIVLYCILLYSRLCKHYPRLRPHPFSTASSLTMAEDRGRSPPDHGRVRMKSRV